MTLTVQNVRNTGMLLVSLFIMATTTLVEAAWPTDKHGVPLDDPSVFSDPQPLVVYKLKKLTEQLGENAERIRKDKSIAYRISDELIAPHIDFPRVTRLIVGKHWRQANPEQRKQLVKEVQELLIRSYVTAMVSYIDEIVAGSKDTRYYPSRYREGDKKASVRASIPLEGGQTADIQYQLYYRDEWKIYDIRIEGISLAMTYRTSFDERIKKMGLDGLITQLAERNRKGEVELPDAIAPEDNSSTAAILPSAAVH
ncbi:MAG TPA: ABC transporter substrate-binding protein [Gammaproteobacteria bacterium]|nr:ABC transporter substrate-binding protein [Gammaproteobacteria bacterium]